jgi:amino acid transporter
MALTSRVLFDIGSHGQAPEVFSRRHPRFATPYVGIGFAAVVALVLALAVGEGSDVTTMIGVLAGTNTLGLIFIYAILVIGSLVDRHERAWAAAAGTAARAVSIVVPLLALALLGYAFYASLFPRPPFPYSLEPYLVAAGVVLALIGAWMLKARGTGFDFVRAASEVEDIPVDVAHVDAPS